MTQHPDPDPSDNPYPVDSTTRTCCGGIGTHTRECRKQDSFGEPLPLSEAVELVEHAREIVDQHLCESLRDRGRLGRLAHISDRLTVVLTRLEKLDPEVGAVNVTRAEIHQHVVTDALRDELDAATLDAITDAVLAAAPLSTWRLDGLEYVSDHMDGGTFWWIVGTVAER